VIRAGRFHRGAALRVAALFWFFLAGLTPCGAQPGRDAPVAVPEDIGTRYKAMLHAERYDEILTDATAALAQKVDADDRYFLHYYRGCANWRLGFLDEAEADMAADIANEDAHPERYPSPRWFLDTIAEQKAARPPHRRDVTLEDGVRLAVFYDSDDLALHQLIDLLPVAVNSVRRLTRTPPRPAVFILFGDIDRMQAFEDIPRRTPLIDDSVLAYGGYHGVHICLSRKPGQYVTDPRGGYFRLTITHEYLHVVVDRILEAHPGLPTWLAEGSANLAGCYSAPAEQAGFALRLKRAIEGKAILPLDALSGRAFYRASGEQFASRRAEDPYAQATGMTQYLLLGRPDTIFADLLQAIRRTNDFPKAFSDTFGETVEEFYADWKAYAAP
jgi:hypothetical protein